MPSAVRDSQAAIKSFQKHLSELSNSGKFFGDVFNDFVRCFALALANDCDLWRGEKWEKREKEYLETISHYKKEEIQEHFPQMCADLTTAFEADPFHDYLGESYMELFGECKGKKNTLGQCFTPIEVCECCAEMALDIERIKEEIQERVVTIADEAVGGGAMLIAACKVLHNHGINYQRKVRFYAADLDPACVYMCYVQLSLLGCRAYVKRQNTITMQVFDEFKTPMEMLYPAFLYADGKINIHSMEK